MQALQPNFQVNLHNSNLNFSNEVGAPLVTKSYKQVFHPTLKHSNATQNIYFSNYIEWQGMVRERWFFECIDSQMLQNKGVFVTKSVHQDYFKEGFPFQEIVCRLNSFSIRNCSFGLAFRFYIDGKLISSGYQKIVFTNHTKKIAKLPCDVIERIRTFEDVNCEFSC